MSRSTRDSGASIGSGRCDSASDAPARMRRCGPRPSSEGPMGGDPERVRAAIQATRYDARQRARAYRRRHGAYRYAPEAVEHEPKRAGRMSQRWMS